MVESFRPPQDPKNPGLGQPLRWFNNISAVPVPSQANVIQPRVVALPFPFFPFRLRIDGVRDVRPLAI